MQRREQDTNPAGFRDRLLHRLRVHANDLGIDVQRLQQRVAFERLLARLAGSGDWILKGGFALELRYGWRNRPTRDVDLFAGLSSHQALERLRTAIAESAIAEPFMFELHESESQLQGAPGGGVRVRVIARVAGVDFARFSIDLASGDVMVGEPDILVGTDVLSFAGIEPVRFPVYPVTQHLAEKLHAYTLPRIRENSRVKDLLDMAMIATQETIDADTLASSLRATFDTRATHQAPLAVPEPPSSWRSPFQRLAREAPGAPMTDLRDAYALVARFWNPILSGTAGGTCWDLDRQVWAG